MIFCLDCQVDLAEAGCSSIALRFMDYRAGPSLSWAWLADDVQLLLRRRYNSSLNIMIHGDLTLLLSRNPSLNNGIAITLQDFRGYEVNIPAATAAAAATSSSSSPSSTLPSPLFPSGDTVPGMGHSEFWIQYRHDCSADNRLSFGGMGCIVYQDPLLARLVQIHEKR
jgi:hypothetical protein